MSNDECAQHRASCRHKMIAVIGLILVFCACLRPKFSSPAARFQGLRLGNCAGLPKIGYPSRHHHPRQSGSGSGNPDHRGSHWPTSAARCRPGVSTLVV